MSPCRECGRLGCAIQLGLYRLLRHPDPYTASWARGELRARWNGRGAGRAAG